MVPIPWSAVDLPLPWYHQNIYFVIFLNTYTRRIYSRSAQRSFITKVHNGSQNNESQGRWLQGGEDAECSQVRASCMHDNSPVRSQVRATPGCFLNRWTPPYRYSSILSTSAKVHAAVQSLSERKIRCHSVTHLLEAKGEVCLRWDSKLDGPDQRLRAFYRYRLAHCAHI